MMKQTVHASSYWWVRGWELSGIWNNNDKISENIFLSSLPMRGNEEKLIRDVGANAKASKGMLVVSVVEDYENNETMYWMDPVRPHEWKKTFVVDDKAVTVDQIQLKMKDFTSGKDINFDAAADVVIKIQNARLQNKQVLVHCKAGRTRSAMIVACVLAFYDLGQLPENANKTSNELIDLALVIVKGNRQQVKVHDSVSITAVKIVNAVKNRLRSEPQPEESLASQIDRLAADKQIKDLLMERSSYRKLLSYRAEAICKTGQFISYVKPVQRVQSIDNLISSLSERNDSRWFYEIINRTGVVKKFLDARPSSHFVGDINKDIKDREDIVSLLRQDIEELFCLNLGCTAEAFNRAFADEARDESKSSMMQHA